MPTRKALFLLGSSSLCFGELGSLAKALCPDDNATADMAQVLRALLQVLGRQRGNHCGVQGCRPWRGARDPTSAWLRSLACRAGCCSWRRSSCVPST